MVKMDRHVGSMYKVKQFFKSGFGSWIHRCSWFLQSTLLLICICMQYIFCMWKESICTLKCCNVRLIYEWLRWGYVCRMVLSWSIKDYIPWNIGRGLVREDLDWSCFFIYSSPGQSFERWTHRKAHLTWNRNEGSFRVPYRHDVAHRQAILYDHHCLGLAFVTTGTFYWGKTPRSWPSKRRFDSQERELQQISSIII